jgi:hypothetical protein
MNPELMVIPMREELVRRHKGSPERRSPGRGAGPAAHNHLSVPWFHSLVFWTGSEKDASIPYGGIPLDTP